MKTTIELPDGLLAEAKRLARRDGTTLKALLEHGLRRALDERQRRRPFSLRTASVGGQGLAPELRAAGWESVRDLSYQDRGGS